MGRFDGDSQQVTMFQVNDRVEIRYYTSSNPRRRGTIISIAGRWITVKHDVGSRYGGAVGAVPNRFDYEAEDLIHISPLLRFVAEI